MPYEKKKWLKGHSWHNQFKVSFLLYADFERILKPVDEQYKMNKMKTERKGKTPYIEK